MMILQTHHSDFEQHFSLMVRERQQTDPTLSHQVSVILREVRENGDAALKAYTQELDGYTAQNPRLSEKFIERQVALCPDAVRAALRLAAGRISAFHQRQKPESWEYTDDAGVRLGLRWRPLAAVGIYVPGGKASYPSSVLMNALPARIAGVERVVMTVPMPSGKISPSVLVAAQIAGITEIYGIGGAQAVGALAYGTESIQPVDKIIGPGNAYVAEAKRQVFGMVGIDAIAGPSEILVVADKHNRPDWIAWDLLSQAEHDPDAQSILITDDAGFAGQVIGCMETILPTLPRSAIAQASWKAHGLVIVIQDMAQASRLIDRIAPEHLQICLDDAAAFAETVRNAGSIFLGPHTPEAIGDYLGGPNHVLPTNRSARFSSGLSVFDFMKRTTYLGCPPAGLKALGDAAMTLAAEESLDAHRGSIKARLDGL